LPTVEKIIAWVDRYYPNQTSVANKILDLDQLHKELYNKLRRFNYDYTVNETEKTVADQLAYDKPNDADFDKIFLIRVSQDQSTGLTNETVWDKYEYADLLSSVGVGKYWTRAGTTEFNLWDSGEAIDTAGYQIQIYYHPKPVTIASSSQTPSLDAQYHNILKYGLTQMQAIQGNNPDADVANYYQNKFDEEFNAVVKNLDRKEITGVDVEQLESRW